MPSVIAGDPGAALPDLPAPMDCADMWLLHAASHLVSACRLPESAFAELADVDLRPLDVLVRPRGAPSPDDPSLAVLLAAAAVEARLNRALRLKDPDDWHSVAHLAPGEKLGLAPRLLRETAALPPAHHELTALTEELFAERAALVESDELPRPPVLRSAELVEAAARICDYVDTLADRPANGEAVAFVRRVATLLAARARALSATPADEPKPDWSWSRDVDFPPDLVGS